jgi:hypothetical protein
MKRNWTILLVASLVLFAFGQAGATVTVRVAASPLIGTNDTLYVDSNFTFDIYMNNVDEGDIVGYSITFNIYSPDNSITEIVHRNVHGFPIEGATVTTDSSVLDMNGFEAYWTAVNSFYGLGWDGTLPDTISNSTIDFSGWPQGLGEHLYIQLALQVNQEGMLCIDSSGGGDNSDRDWMWLGNPATVTGRPWCYRFINAGPQGIRDHDGSTLPKEFELGQNYPNPFNPATVIEFALPTASNVSLAVYNILGQKVKTLVDGELDAGYKSVTWNGTTDSGSPAASGIYFYKLKAKNFESTKKLMLLK